MRKFIVVFISMISIFFGAILPANADEAVETWKLLIENGNKVFERINLVENKIDILSKDVDVISSATYNKGFALFCILSFVFTISLIWVLLYINKILKRLDEKDKEIDNDKKLIQEIKYMFKKIKIDNEYINNIFVKLVDTDLDSKYFDLLKIIYFSLDKNDKDSCDHTLILMWKNFPLKLFLEDKIWDNFCKLELWNTFSNHKDKENIIKIITEFYLEHSDSYKERYKEFLYQMGKDLYTKKFKDMIENLFKKRKSEYLFFSIFESVDNRNKKENKTYAK